MDFFFCIQNRCQEPLANISRSRHYKSLLYYFVHAANVLAQGVAAGGVVQGIIHKLECHAKVVAIGFEGVALTWPVLPATQLIDHRSPTQPHHCGIMPAWPIACRRLGFQANYQDLATKCVGAAWAS